MLFHISQFHCFLFSRLMIDLSMTPVHCGTIYLTQAQLSGAVKVHLGLKKQPLQKRSFLTAFSKIHGTTKLEKLGSWQSSIWFKNLWPFFFLF